MSFSIKKIIKGGGSGTNSMRVVRGDCTGYIRSKKINRHHNGGAKTSLRQNDGTKKSQTPNFDIVSKTENLPEHSIKYIY